MNVSRRMLAGALVAILVSAVGLSVYAQAKRPYRDGSVWDITFVRMKPGMEAAYLTYLANDWKRQQEAMKKEGFSLSYKVIRTEGHTAGDWNLMLMVEYKDLASMEANGPKAEAVVQKLFGDDQKQQQGYKDRAEIREIVGGRLAREVVLEPRP